MITFYTCITGNHGHIANVNRYKKENRKFVCFYDDDNSFLPKTGWDFVKLNSKNVPTKIFDKSKRHLQRYIKTNTFDYLPNTEYACWVDPRFDFIKEDFFLYMEESIKSFNVSYRLLPHPQRISLADELVWAYTSNKLSYEECIFLIDTLNKYQVNFDDFFTSSLTIFLIKNTKNSKIIGKQWFELIDKCYKEKELHLRDQAVFPFAISLTNNKDYVDFLNVNRFGGYEEWKNNLGIVGKEHADPPNTRHNWRGNIANFLVDVQKKTGSTIASPMFDIPIL